jgi:hypothetical protein
LCVENLFEFIATKHQENMTRGGAAAAEGGKKEKKEKKEKEKDNQLI